MRFGVRLLYQKNGYIKFQAVSLILQILLSIRAADTLLFYQSDFMIIHLESYIPKKSMFSCDAPKIKPVVKGRGTSHITERG